MSHDADTEKMKEFEDADKIGFEDLNTMFMSTNDTGSDILTRKKMVWDRTKKMYKQHTINARGEQLNGGRMKEKVKDNKVAGDKFKQWKRKNMMGFQKLGEQENVKDTNRSMNMFKDRQKVTFRGESSYNYKGIYAPEKKESKKENSGVKNSEMAKKIPVQNELKEFGTILKRKKKERGNNMLQMDKGSRTKVLEKNKLARKDKDGPRFKKGHIFNKPDAKFGGVKAKGKRGAKGGGGGKTNGGEKTGGGAQKTTGRSQSRVRNGAKSSARGGGSAGRSNSRK